MKFGSKLYAKSLVLATKTGISQDRIIANFINLLKKNNDLYLAPKILEYAEKFFLQEEGKNKVIIETARPQQDLIIKIKNIFNPSSNVLEEKINPKLIAGVKILINKEQKLDFSLKRKIDKLFKNNVY